MTGTKIGALKARDKIKSRDPDFYKKIGKIGGQNSFTGGLFADPVRAAQVGKIGGSRSKRGYKLVKDDGRYIYYIDNVTGEVVKYNHDGTLENH